MKLRAQKRILFYLEQLAKKLKQEKNQNIYSEIRKNLITEDLISIILWLFPNKWKQEILSLKTDDELLELIHSDVNILRYTIKKIEENMTNIVQYSQAEVTTFFKSSQNEIHYLASKPVEDWDSYDKANYHSLLSKTNTSKKVYGIFTSDVLAENVYAVTTKPSYFFDSKEEAVEYAGENAIEAQVQEPNKRKVNIRPNGYSENFATGRRGAWTH
jgi:hypothetical protein